MHIQTQNLLLLKLCYSRQSTPFSTVLGLLPKRPSSTPSSAVLALLPGGTSKRHTMITLVTLLLDLSLLVLHMPITTLKARAWATTPSRLSSLTPSPLVVFPLIPTVSTLFLLLVMLLRPLVSAPNTVAGTQTVSDAENSTNKSLWTHVLIGICV